MRANGQDRPDYSGLIARCRGAAGLSRAELAARASVPEAVVSLWEDPSYEGVDLSILQRVARATGTELVLDFRPSVREVPAPAAALPAAAAADAPVTSPGELMDPSPSGPTPPRRVRTRSWLDLLDHQVA